MFLNSIQCFIPLIRDLTLTLVFLNLNFKFECFLYLYIFLSYAFYKDIENGINQLKKSKITGSKERFGTLELNSDSKKNFSSIGLSKSKSGNRDMTHISPSTGLAASKISKRIKNSGRKRKYMTSKHNLMKSSENRSTSISTYCNKIDRFEKILTSGKNDPKKVVTSEVVLIILFRQSSKSAEKFYISR